MCICGVHVCVCVCYFVCVYMCTLKAGRAMIGQSSTGFTIFLLRVVANVEVKIFYLDFNNLCHSFCNQRDLKHC
jgi:hypothetical protein